VRQPRAVEIVFARQKNLRLRLQLPKGVRVDDAIAIHLERRAVIALAAPAERFAIKDIVKSVRHRNALRQQALPGRK